MFNVIGDFMFNHAYAFINVIVILNTILLVTSFVEAGQEEIDSLVEFYEEDH